MIFASPADLIQQLRDRITDPARQAIVEQIAQDVTTLHVRALAGEQVQQELAHAHAQALSLTATEAAFLRDALLGWVGQVAGAVVHGVFASLPKPA